MVLAVNNTPLIAEPRQHGWTPAEEDRLFRIVTSERLNGRTTTEQWQKIADRLAAEGAALGFKLRTASSVRHRAVKIDAYSRERIEPTAAVREVEAVHLASQRSFGEREAVNLIADVLKRVAKELRSA